VRFHKSGNCRGRRPNLLLSSIIQCPDGEVVSRLSGTTVTCATVEPDGVVVADEPPHGATGKLNKLAPGQKYQNYLLEGGGAAV
jgi:hypothetical protein